MPDYHLVLHTRRANLSLLMRHINGVYTQAFNRRHNKVGHRPSVSRVFQSDPGGLRRLFSGSVPLRGTEPGACPDEAQTADLAVVPEGRYLTIVDLEGQQGVDFLRYNVDDPEERYHAPNTLKAIQTLKLTAGHHLYFDIARPIFTINFDSCDGHDTIAGCCSAPSNKMLYGVDDIPGCRENDFVRAIEAGTRAQEHCPQYQLFL